MVSFIDFYFHFLADFSDLNFALYVLYICPCYVTWHTQWAWVTCTSLWRTSLLACMSVSSSDLSVCIISLRLQLKKSYPNLFSFLFKYICIVIAHCQQQRFLCFFSISHGTKFSELTFSTQGMLPLVGTKITLS